MSESKFPWRTLLFVSLAFNLLIMGAALGALGAGVRLQRASAEAVVDRMPGPRAFMAALPAETRVKVREELTRSWVESRELRRSARDARREAFAAMSVEPYDVEHVRDAFARQREADQAAIAVFHNNVVEAFGALTPEERREALDSLRRAAPPRERGAPAVEDGVDQPAPLNEETRMERRERLREALRERRRARQEAQP